MGVRMSQKEFDKIIKDKEIKKTPYNKYHNNRIKVDNISYDSKHEYERHCQLKILEKNGEIKNLRYHDKQDLITLIDDPLVRYEPDFCYIENGVKIIEDVKGVQTKEFILKKKIIISKLKKGEIKGKFRLTKYVTKGNFDIIEEYTNS